MSWAPKMPRLFGEVADWFETDLPHYPFLLHPSHLIRVEDERTTYDRGVLQVRVPLAAPQPAGRKIPVTARS